MILNSIIEQFHYPVGWLGIFFFGACACILLLIFFYKLIKFHLVIISCLYINQCRFLYENVFKVFLNSRFSYVCNIFVIFWTSVLIYNIFSLFSIVTNVYALFRVVFILTFSLFGFTVFYALSRMRLRFFGLFMPCNVPGYLIKSLIVIEGFVFFLRIFSLSLRLFINLLAGHIFLKTIFIVGLHLVSTLCVSGFFLLNIIVLICFFISFCTLETFVASLQTFIFFFLLNIYLQELLPDDN